MRSHESLLKEAEQITQEKDFKGYIHDVGGPTANFRHPSCKKQLKYGVCRNRQCLFPQPCRNLDADHSDYVSLLKKLRAVPGVKKVFIRSGIRFDYLLADRKQEFLRELCEYHVSGQLKVAPEHVSAPVLSLMGKPEHRVYEEFIRRFRRMNERLGKKQYLVPYLMSSHPGSGLKEASTAGIWGICLNRYRTSIRRRPPSPPVCIIPGSIRVPCSRSMYRKIPMRRRCSGR